MRCAVFCPTPGRMRSASMSCSSNEDGMIVRSPSERQLHSRRHRQACRRRAHFFLRYGVDLCNCVVEGSEDEVLGHFRIRQRSRIDAHLAAFHPPAQGDVDHAAGTAGDFHAGELLLRTLHVFLHLLRLLHQLGNVSAHVGLSYSSKGRMESGTSVAPCRGISCCTPGSAMKEASAATWRASRSRAPRWCRVSPVPAAASNRTCGTAPSAEANDSASAFTRLGILRCSSAAGSDSRNRPSP